MSASSILSSLGTGVSIISALSPVPTMRTILTEKSIGEFSIIPYIVTFCQCILWISYAVLTPGKDQLIPVNILVLFFQFIYLLIFIRFSSADVGGDRRREILKAIFIPFLGTASIVIIACIVSQSSATKFLGVSCVVANMAAYGAPLTVVRTVIETRSVRYMPFLLSFVGTIAACIWTSWAFVVNDSFVLVPNLVGAILGIIQLAVYFKYKAIEDRERRMGGILPVTTTSASVSGSTEASTILDETGQLIQK